MSDFITSTMDYLTKTTLSPWVKCSLVLALPFLGWMTVFILNSPLLFGCIWIILMTIGVTAECVNAENAEASSNNDNKNASSPPTTEVPNVTKSQLESREISIDANQNKKDGQNLEPDVGTQTERKAQQVDSPTDEVSNIKVTPLVNSNSGPVNNDVPDEKSVPVSEETSWIFPEQLNVQSHQNLLSFDSTIDMASVELCN